VYKLCEEGKLDAENAEVEAGNEEIGQEGKEEGIDQEEREGIGHEGNENAHEDGKGAMELPKELRG